MRPAQSLNSAAEQAPLHLASRMPPSSCKPFRRLNDKPVHLRRYRTLEKVDAHDNAPGILLAHQHALESLQRSAGNPHPIANPEIWPRLHRQPGGYHCSQSVDFRLRHVGRFLPAAHNGTHPGGSEYLHAPSKGKPDKEISRKQGEFQLLHPIRPDSPGSIKRQECLHPQAGAESSDCSFMLMANGDSEPSGNGIRRFSVHVLNLF